MLHVYQSFDTIVCKVRHKAFRTYTCTQVPRDLLVLVCKRPEIVLYTSASYICIFDFLYFFEAHNSMIQPYNTVFLS